MIKAITIIETKEYAERLGYVKRENIYYKKERNGMRLLNFFPKEDLTKYEHPVIIMDVTSYRINNGTWKKPKGTAIIVDVKDHVEFYYDDVLFEKLPNATEAKLVSDHTNY